MTREHDVLSNRGLIGKLGLAKAANRERDQGHWAAAADLYAAFLAAAGRNRLTFGHVVQLGNCLKEAGRFEEALAAYDDAVRIDSRNADVHLQRGHLHKLMGNMPASAWAYQRAYNLDPANRHARQEIEASGAIAQAGIDLPEGKTELRTIFFDVTDFIEYAQCNVSLSGIQRVCGNLMLSVETLALTGYRVVPVLPDYETGRFYSVPLTSFNALVRTFQATHVVAQDVLKGVEAVVTQRAPVTPMRDDVFIIAGAFWIISRYDKVAELRRRGMKFGLFLHDLIQIRNPDYVMPDAVDRFTIQLSDALELCDFVLTNSRYVRDDVRAYLRDTKHLDLPVLDVLLPTELTFAPSSVAVADPDHPALRFVLAHDYVLIVSTIEVRKNHTLLIRVWEQLRAEFGDAVPHLVFVGKWGWQIDALRDHIDRQGYDGDWLFIFNGISDNVMETLYKRALFTVYPSFAEGFGLPIGESLAYGKPCIASNTTAMPEVGGDFVRYFDPFDLDSALSAIRQAIVDRDDLQRWQDRIATDFKAKTWRDFCDHFYRAVMACAEEASEKAPASLPLLPSRELITGGDHDVLIAAAGNRPIITFRAARAANWHACESWGVWSADRRCEIAFRTDLPAGEKVAVFLRLHRPNSSDRDPTVIVDAGDGAASIVLTMHPTFYRFTGIVGEGGTVSLHLLARGKFPRPEARNLYLGWSGLAYCRHGNEQDETDTIARLMPAGIAG